MLRMAKKRTTPEGEPVRRPNRKAVSTHIGFPPALRLAIESLAERNRRPLTTEILIAVEEHLRRSGVEIPDTTNN